MIGVAVAGGGERVVAWEIGVLAGLADGGLDLRGAARIVGTSAGALVAARLAAGEDPREAARRIARDGAVGAGAAALASGAGPSDAWGGAAAAGARGAGPSDARGGAAAARASGAGPSDARGGAAAAGARGAGPSDAGGGAAAALAPSGPVPPGADAFARLATAWEAAGETLTERRRSFGRLAIVSSPGGEERFVARQEALLDGADWSPALRIVAIDADSGERVVFGHDSDVPLARAVAASRAVPTLRPPVRIGDRRFIDGALGSATNADLLTGAGIVIAPFAADDPLWGPPLREEITEDTIVIHAGPAERTAMGPDPMSGATAVLAVRSGRRVRRMRPRQRATVAPAWS
jgi:NTE family protein